MITNFLVKSKAITHYYWE